jgi:hypothetical protein
VLPALVTQCEIAVGNHAKGEAMADLVEHVFAAVPGMTCTYPGFTEPDKTDEIDLTFRHFFLQSGLTIPQITLMMSARTNSERFPPLR